MKSSLFNKAENHITVDDILAENERRNAMINMPFDPVTGKHSLGERTLLEIPDYILPIQYIPIEMERESLIEGLRDAGSIRLLASRNGENAEKIADALLRLRLRYDFPFWAATVVFIKRKGGGEDVRFVLNRPQRRLIELFEERRKSNLPIRLILLKARQWGGSTLCHLLIYLNLTEYQPITLLLKIINKKEPVDFSTSSIFSLAKVMASCQLLVLLRFIPKLIQLSKLFG